MRLALIVVFTLFHTFTFSQSAFEAVIKDAETQEPLPGATASIKVLGLGVSADKAGRIRLEGVPAGKHVIEFSFVGYSSQKVTINFPYESSQPYQVNLKAEHKELDEIVITSTRSSRTIADIPTRVEFIAAEELDEKANMKPGDIRMLLNESTGIHPDFKRWLSVVCRVFRWTWFTSNTSIGLKASGGN
jgi:outer membrane receptor for ferrienterochelin and colicins